MHLRNTLAKGMDAESYSLHTFEALLSQSMENLGNLWLQVVFALFLFALNTFFLYAKYFPFHFLLPKKKPTLDEFD